ncbi:UNVERIFIED_CONTAM: Glucose-6-phosphate 1-dehydrogenase 6, cytoplasmic [Sesamum angustifolium]|uniref:glucose-6-phosphate dehydrogenase (NADP(+)) n=1 Tax=Sesamum angustifolium TaxID=2727405 RepID=A0AAW2NMJ5_9LAMI
MAASGEWHCEKRPFSKNESFARDNENVPETGCLSIIVLGASGDLAKKKTFPALFNLYRQIKYVSGSYDAPEGFQELDKAISEHEISKNSTEGSSRRLFYLALPPSVYPQVSKMIKSYCMNKSDLGGWTRIVVEKPFGKDLASAEELSSQIGEFWCFVLQIASFYLFGIVITLLMCRIIRDIIQNHLLQVLCLVAMEKPVSLKPEHIRDEKVKVLQSVVPIKDERCAWSIKAIRMIQQFRMTQTLQPLQQLWQPGREELWASSAVSSHVDNCLDLDNDMFRFFIVSHQFYQQDDSLRRVGLCRSKARKDEFVIRLQPSEAIYMKLTVKQPGLEMSVVQSELDLSYRQRYQGVVIPEAYERLILDTIKGDQQHFVRRDELKAAWEIFTPLLHRIDQGEFKSLPYKPGSRGPVEADELLERAGYVQTHGYIWIPPTL